MRRGFSLIELSIIIAILAVLATGIYLTFGKDVDKSRVAKTESMISKLDRAIGSYYSDTGFYPSKTQQLWKNDEGTAGWYGPYVQPPLGDDSLNLFPKTPWGGTARIACSDGQSVSLVMTGMSRELCLNLDQDIDDGDLSSGLVRWDSANDECVYYVEINNPGVRCK